MRDSAGADQKNPGNRLFCDRLCFESSGRTTRKTCWFRPRHATAIPTDQRAIRTKRLTNPIPASLGSLVVGSPNFF
jgi:hypothetical protein